MALCAGLLTTCFYEFCHCIQHLSYKPKNRMLAPMKARHMAHHFHDESGNFGITNFVWDKAFGTFYERRRGRRSRRRYSTWAIPTRLRKTIRGFATCPAGSPAAIRASATAGVRDAHLEPERQAA